MAVAGISDRDIPRKSRSTRKILDSDAGAEALRFWGDFRFLGCLHFLAFTNYVTFTGGNLASWN